MMVHWMVQTGDTYEEAVSLWTLQLEVKEIKKKELLIYITEKPRALASVMAESRC